MQYAFAVYFVKLKNQYRSIEHLKQISLKQLQYAPPETVLSFTIGSQGALRKRPQSLDFLHLVLADCPGSEANDTVHQPIAES